MKKDYEHGSAEQLAGNTNTSFLKILALFFMLLDHLGASLYSGVPELRIVGRIAFPLYAWCLVVGSVKTRSPLRYGLRLLLMAVVSQPIYMMALNHTWSDMNIMFTLLIALIAIQGIRMHWMGSQVWLPALCYLVLGFLKVDYGWRGITFILVLYFSRESKAGLCAAFLAYALYWGASSSSIKSIFGFVLPFSALGGIGTVLQAFFKLQGMVWLALPLIAIPMNVQFRMPKWVGYALYPCHLIFIICLKLISGYTLPMLMRGF